MHNRTERLPLCLTPEEKDLIETAAELDGVSMSAFVRQAVMHRVKWRGIARDKLEWQTRPITESMERAIAEELNNTEPDCAD